MQCQMYAVTMRGNVMRGKCVATWCVDTMRHRNVTRTLCPQQRQWTTMQRQTYAVAMRGNGGVSTMCRNVKRGHNVSQREAWVQCVATWSVATMCRNVKRGHNVSQVVATWVRVANDNVKRDYSAPQSGRVVAM
jgi:hypothetical protein